MIKKTRKLSHDEKIVEKRKQLAEKGKVAAIWTRVSSADQYKQNYSIDTQKAACREYCERNNIRIKGYFGGENESAKFAGEKFLDMIGTVGENPEYNTIVVFDFDRFSRNSIDGITYKSTLKRKGITIESVNQPIDTNNILAEQIENILIIMADIDNAMRRHKCHDGMVACIKRGELYSRPPFGYDSRKEGKRHIITINEDGKTLKKAFEWIVEEPEISQAEIIRRLEARGLNISKQKLSQCLHNSFYCGLLEHRYLNGEIIKGKQEAMISESTFYKVQDILAGNNKNYQQAEETPEFPLKMHVFCAKDNHALSGYTVKKKGLKYYKCGVKGCGTNVSAEELHSKYAEILNGLNVPESLLPIYKRVIERKFKEKENDNLISKNAIEKNLSTLKTKLKKAKMRFLTEDGIDNDDYNEVKSDLETKIANCEKELKDCSRDLSNLAEYTDVAFKIASSLGSTWGEMDFKVCQKIQNLAFPKGIKWDGEKRCYRTDGMNEFFRQIGLLRGSARGEGIKKTGTDCSMSVLVAGGGHFTGIFGDSYPQLKAVQGRRTGAFGANLAHATAPSGRFPSTNMLIVLH